MNYIQPAAAKVVLQTLARVNKTLASNPNALTSTVAGDVEPDTAYIELVRSLIWIAEADTINNGNQNATYV